MAHGKRPADPLGGHVRLYWKLLDSPAWLALGWAAQGIYIALRRKLNATNNGNIEATLTTLRHAGVRSSSTLASALRALETVGLIAKTRQGGIAGGGKLCSLYRFTDQEVFDQPRVQVTKSKATNEWQSWPTVRAAKAAIREADQAAKRDPTKNTSKLRNSNRTASEIESESVSSASDFEQVATSPLRKSKLAKVVSIGR